GETVSDTIAATLEREPDWSAMPAQTPPSIRRLLQRCLEKDPKRRLRDIGDARLEIEEAPGRKAAARPVRLARWVAAAAGLLVVGAVAAWQLQRSEYFWRNPLEDAKFRRL